MSPPAFDAPVLVAVHVAAALATAAAGVAAVRSAPGGRAHRRAGTLYVAGWALLAVLGGWIGAEHAGVSPFEVMNVLGMTLVLLGYAPAFAPRLRPALNRADGRGWLRWHLRLMVASLPFLVVAGVNQTLPLLGAGSYSMAGFYGGIALAAVVTPLASRALLRRHRLLLVARPVAGAA